MIRLRKDILVHLTGTLYPEIMLKRVIYRSFRFADAGFSRWFMMSSTADVHTTAQEGFVEVSRRIIFLAPRSESTVGSEVGLDLRNLPRSSE